MTDFSNLTVVGHPLVGHKLAILRSRETPKKRFKELVDELAMLLAYEVTIDLPTRETEIDTPLETARARVLAGKKPVIVPILRAGLGMVDGVLRMMPGARVGHIGLYRNEETLEPVHYYFKIPGDVADRRFLVVDPMLATGGTAVAAIDRLKERGADDIRFMCLVAAPEGVGRMRDAHPDVRIISAALDRCLDENGYIRPGLGDAGDRLFGTR